MVLPSEALAASADAVVVRGIKGVEVVAPLGRAANAASPAAVDVVVVDGYDMDGRGTGAVLGTDQRGTD